MATWIPILVRQDDYTEIASLVAEREAGRTDGEPVIPEHEARVPAYADAGAKPSTHEDERLANHVPWSQEDLSALAEGKTITTERWTRAIDVCADEPETWLPTSEVAKRAGMTINEWRDAPRKITRHLRKHYPDVPRNENGDAWWPLCVGGNDIPANGGEVWWTITAEMANRWHAVRDHGASTSNPVHEDDTSTDRRGIDDR